MTKFLQYLESSGKFRKTFICKVYRSIHIGSNSLKKTIKQSSLATFGKNAKGTKGKTKKRPKWPNFKDRNIKAKFGDSKYIKYVKVYISFKATLSAFHCFLFHKNFRNTFEVIALLLKADTIFGNFSVNFCLV